MQTTNASKSKNVLEPGGHWRNWVGNQSCVVSAKGAPASEDELCEMVRMATSRGLNVRCAGSGHSFTPIVQTSGLLLSMGSLKGIHHIDQSKKRVTVAAGTTINELCVSLRENGLSMINQGDIDTQALAGALSTGTHGTGAKLQNLAAAIVGMKLVQPNGDIVVVDESTPELLRAGRVSLGLLGVISEITLQVTDAFNLHDRIWRMDFEECMERHDDLASKHRHFSFFWCASEDSAYCYRLPDTSATSKSGRKTDFCEVKVMDITDQPPMAREFETIAYSAENYPIDYVANFHELEYALPVADGKDAVMAVRRLMLETYPECIYPIEYRFTAADDAWLSPFFERDSVTVSVSGEPGTDYWAYLRDVDTILRRYNARPHWGKLHFLTAEDVENLYPNASNFKAMRRKMDPEGAFLNDHLAQLLK